MENSAYGYGGFEWAQPGQPFQAPPPPPPPPYPPGIHNRFNGAEPRFQSYEQVPVRITQPPIPGEDYYKSAAAHLPPLPPSDCPMPPPPPPPPLPSLRTPSPPQRQFRPFRNPPPAPSIGRGYSSNSQLHRSRYDCSPNHYSSKPPLMPPSQFPLNYPRTQPLFPEETARVRRTFVHNEFVPSNYDNSNWSSTPTQAVPSLFKKESTSDTNLKDGSNGSTNETSITVNPTIPALLQAPLQPPPMPPLFDWTPAAQSQNSCAELKHDLPFIPVTVEKIDLAKMYKKFDQEKNNSSMINLEKSGLAEASWPMELKLMFQPLYCKLCTLTLSSCIVAKDHYKGKKHKKCVENWLYNFNKQSGTQSAKKVVLPRNLCPTGKASARIISPGDTEIPSLLASDLPKPVTSNALPPKKPGPPISGSNTTPLGNPGEWRKRQMESSSKHRSHKEGISKRFPLGRPPSKKSKSDPNAGPNFDYCVVCNLALTSPAHAEQHYGGKNHKKKIEEPKVVRPPPPPPPRIRASALSTDEMYAAPLPQIRPPLNFSFQYF